MIRRCLEAADDTALSRGSLAIALSPLSPCLCMLSIHICSFKAALQKKGKNDREIRTATLNTRGFISDINECNKKSDDCHELAKCTNTAGSYSCRCKLGYTDVYTTAGCMCNDA